MLSLHVHRLLIIAPVGIVPAVVAWMNANISPNAVAIDLGPGLNAAGLDTDPITHRWMCGSFTNPQCKLIVARLCQVASVTPPNGATWDGWTQKQKITAVRTLQADLKSGAGLHVGLVDNTDPVWEDTSAALAGMGLKIATSKIR